jgi:very-short-patch-repair endonuclease
MAKQTKICEECKKEYSTFNTKQKFCNRSCYAKEDSRRKKQKYETEPHHNVGRKVSESERKMRVKRTTETWQNDKIRKKRLEGLQKARENSKYPIGWSPEAIEKRNKTFEVNGRHNLSGKFGTRQCDKTYFEKHGKWSYESLNDKSVITEFTKPEMEVFDILINNKIVFESQYEFRGRYFDFAIPSKKILLEIDGVYWHGKNVSDNELNETQQRTRENDKYKNMLVESSEWTLIRIWEDEIKYFDFSKL